MPDARLSPDAAPLPAVWHDGKTAAAHDVVLACHAPRRELRLCAPERPNPLSPLAVWKANEVRVLSGRLEPGTRQPVRLGLTPDDGQRLVLTDERALDAVARWLAAPARERRTRTLRRWGMGAAAIWIIGLALFFGGHHLFSAVASYIPRSWEESLGRSARQTVISTLESTGQAEGEDADLSRNRELLALVQRLEAAMPAGGYEFDLLVLRADFVNAFALPGGYMLVTTGLIDFCRDPDELAGVLAHEMAHVTERHGTSAVLRQYTWSGLLHLMGFNDSLAGGVAATLLTSSFSRKDERTADALGADRLVRAAISPGGMADFFDRLQAEEGASGYLRYISSHPESAERRDAIRRKLEEAAPQNDPEAAARFSPAMSAEAWRELRAQAASGQSPPSGDTRQSPSSGDMP